MLGASLLLVTTVVASAGLLRCYREFPLRQLQSLVIIQTHMAVAMVTVGSLVLLSPKQFPSLESRQFAIGATAIALASLQAKQLAYSYSKQRARTLLSDAPSREIGMRYGLGDPSTLSRGRATQLGPGRSFS